jgi:hypothetical protein
MELLISLARLLSLVLLSRSSKALHYDPCEINNRAPERTLTGWPVALALKQTAKLFLMLGPAVIIWLIQMKLSND